MKGATSLVETAYPSEVPEFIASLSGVRVVRSLVLRTDNTMAKRSTKRYPETR